MNALLYTASLARKRAASPAGVDYADMTITVTDDIAAADDGVTYLWPVYLGGPGAPAGKIGVSNDTAFFTYGGENFAFQVYEGGSGGAVFTVSGDVGGISIGTHDIQWQVYEE